MSGERLYGYAIPGRHGLGNMLFSWARCFLWCGEHQATMIAPMWTQLRLGPYVRRESDKRQYQRLFRHDGYVNGLRRLALLALLPKIPEGTTRPAAENASATASIVVFRGMTGMFEPLRERHAEVRAEIERITRPELLPPKGTLAPYIGVHVRRGDFGVASDALALRQGVRNVRIPLQWYVTLLKGLRRALGFEASARVYSDGTERELSELLAVPGVIFDGSGQAVTDMLALARARGMIASGSTFSMWASFLGQVPCIWHPGQRRQLLVSRDDTGSLEPEIAAGQDLPAEFVRTVQKRWRDSDWGGS